MNYMNKKVIVIDQDYILPDAKGIFTRLGFKNKISNPKVPYLSEGVVFAVEPFEDENTDLLAVRCGDREVLIDVKAVKFI